MRVLLICLLTLFMRVSIPAFAAETERVDTGKVFAQLISSHDAVAPGQDFYVALRTELDPGWHTYWQNPGDSGEPVQITWDIPDTLSHGDIIWPLPHPIPTGPIINYGFENVPFFPVKFSLSETAKLGDTLTINADIYYLVCEEVCIPEDAQLSLKIKIGQAVVDERWNAAINNALKDAPQSGEIQASIHKDGSEAVIHVSNLPKGISSESLYFFPYQQGILDHSAPQTVTSGQTGYALRVPAAYLWDDGTPDRVDGVIGYTQTGVKTGQIVRASTATPLDIGLTVLPSSTESTGGITIWGAVLGALLGGLILNLMPCVFPVISLKAIHIAKMAHGERKAIQREAWIYTAGVIATFLTLTALLILLKQSWGFQLQSPPVIGALALLLFVVGLNLLGAFEMGGSLQGVGSELTHKGGGLGSFFTGALAVIVATPCTAPFMAGAIGFAVTQSIPVTIAVFLALAIGFALPFILISYIPAILKLIPKPGPWMVTFKELLAFPMFAAVIWLIWVLTLQAGEMGLLRLLMAFLAVGLAIWLFRQKGLLSRSVASLCVMGAVATTFMLHPKAVAYAGTDVWTPEKVTELRAEGQAVFIDFTAAWCVTCQVNKKTVLDREEVREAFTRTNTAFLVADWTNKNDLIKTELAKHGRVGVPLYLLYTPGHNDVSPEILPQILTKDMVIDKAEAIRKNHSGR